MKKIKLSTLTDTVCTYLFSVLFLLAVVLRKLKPLKIKFISSLIFAIIPAVIIFLILQIKSNDKDSLFEDEKKKNCYIDALFLYTDSQLNAFFKNIFDKINVKYKAQKNGISVGKYRLKFIFIPDEITLSEIYREIKKTPKTKTLAVIGNKFSQTVTAFSDGNPDKLRLINADAVYKLMQKAEIYPTEFKQVKSHYVKNATDILKLKKSSKQFFFSGSAMLLFSLISIYPLYYIIVGCSLLFTSCLLILFGKRTISQQTVCEILTNT